MPRRDLRPPPADVPRKHRAALDRTLAAWRRRGHLVGDEHAATRALLRGLADTADRAATDHLAGQASAFSRARCLAELAAAVDRYAPASEPAPDPHAQQLEAAALAIIADLDSTNPITT